MEPMMEPESEGPATNHNSSQEFSEDLLRVYYDSSYLLRREFSFTLEHDIYIRYKSFKDKEELAAQIQALQPHKIDIGAVYSLSPRDHDKINPSEFVPLERELVFDIDMTDYDSVRTCCEGANICTKCWSFMTAAIKVLDVALRDDFGFQHVLWVYSGRRGVHCWVCDEIARGLTNEAREAVVQYLTVYQGEGNNSRYLGYPLHPSLSRAFEILEPLFVEWIVSEKGQALLCTPEGWAKVLNRIPDPAIAASLDESWKSSKCKLSPEEKWEQLKSTIRSVESQSKAKKMKVDKTTSRKLHTFIEELVFYYMYPRLDENVSKHRNHLLKAPFAVHPKTGRVCVPIKAGSVDQFKPFQVPTLARLVAELDDFNNSNTDPLSKDSEDWEKTSLRPSVQIFLDFYRKVRSSVLKTVKEEKERAAAVTGDW